MADLRLDYRRCNGGQVWRIVCGRALDRFGMACGSRTWRVNEHTRTDGTHRFECRTGTWGHLADIVHDDGSHGTRDNNRQDAHAAAAIARIMMWGWRCGKTLKLDKSCTSNPKSEIVKWTG